MNKRIKEIQQNKEIKEVNFITFCYVLIPKIILETIGLLDESYFMYVEDLDYSYKVWKSSCKLFHVPEVKIWHKVSASSGEEISEFSAYWIMKSRIKFINRLPLNKRIFSLLFIIFSRPLRYTLLLPKNRNIVVAQLRGLRNGLKDEAVI